jgi:UDP-arabinose 4-epimerase
MSGTVFVTGGAGYVGAHCCKAYAEAGWNVIVYDNLSRGWRDFVRWGPLIEGDILDAEHLTSAIREARPDAVAHFAALAYVGESVADPGKYYRVNSAGALNILDAMRSCDVSAIVFSSTCATYGAPIRTPIEEDHPQAPINPYGWSKLLVEKMLGDHDRAHAIRHVALRDFNAAGADPDGAIGYRHEPETHVIPLAIRGALQNGYAFTIHSGDYETRDGTAVRDYIHVSDLADAHLRALDHLCAGGRSDVFNLGTGVGTSVLDSQTRSSGRPAAPLPAGLGPAARAIRRLWWRAQTRPRACLTGARSALRSTPSSPMPGAGIGLMQTSMHGRRRQARLERRCG